MTATETNPWVTERGRDARRREAIDERRRSDALDLIEAYAVGDLRRARSIVRLYAAFDQEDPVEEASEFSPAGSPARLHRGDLLQRVGDRGEDRAELVKLLRCNRGAPAMAIA